MEDMEFEEIKEIIEEMDEYVPKSKVKRSTGERKTRWYRRKIEAFLKAFADAVEPGKIKKKEYEWVFDTFYNANEEYKVEVFSDENKKKSWINTFIKIANTIAKNNDIPVRIGRRDREGIFIFERLPEDIE